MQIDINLTEEFHKNYLQQSYQNITPWQDINTNIIQYALITKNHCKQDTQKKLLNKSDDKNIHNLLNRKGKRNSNIIQLLEKICINKKVSESCRLKQPKQKAFQPFIPQFKQQSLKPKNNNVIFKLNKVLKNQLEQKRIKKQGEIKFKNGRFKQKLSINTIINGIDQYERIKTQIKHTQKIRQNKNMTQLTKRMGTSKDRYKNIEQILHLPEITKKLSQKYNIQKDPWSTPHYLEKSNKLN